ncbi:MAG: hypothetical protein MUF00_00365 [Gemmatimonadaceae bacterium]|jgi:hypothetical protein|nr:hypothetical protein [Gemmatimonadaceae bacterium]
MPRSRSLDPVHRAFDEARFGPLRTLNLRAQQPTAVQAAVQCEQWLRMHQAQGSEEVLVITGRGNQSAEDYSPVREAIVRLLPSLRRRNVIAHYGEHTPGSFVVTLATLGQLFDTAPRRRERATPSSVPTVAPTLAALSPETLAQLRRLAESVIDDLGVVSPTRAMIDDEMTKQFAQLARAVPTDVDPDAFLRAAIDRALAEMGR